MPRLAISGRLEGGRVRPLRHRLLVVASLACLAAAGSAASGSLRAAAAGQREAVAFGSPDSARRHRDVVQTYCVTCHSAALKTAGLDLQTADFTAQPVGDNGELWEKVIRKINTGTMPPRGVRRPDPKVLESLAAWLADGLDREAQAHPNPGRPLVHRLNRYEYGNAVRDLLHLDVDVSELLPADDAAYGFDNISEVLGLSPVQVERYVAAAEYISALAVGEPNGAPGSATYRVRHDRSQDQHVEGAPFGTVGGIQVRHLFPEDGEYELRATLLRTNLDVVKGLEYPNDVEMTVDGARVFLGTIGGGADEPDDNATSSTADAIDARLRVRVRVEAGPRTIGAAFIQRRGLGTTRLQPFLRSSAGPYDATGRPHIQTLTVVGPFNATGAGNTPSRARIFQCRPAGNKADEARCARRIVSSLARRAYRRNVTDEDVAPLMAFYEAGRREGTFDTGIQRALHRILASPKFLLRVERQKAGVPAGQAYQIADDELASRLSFFLWSSLPDDELLDLASRGRLKDPDTLERQVRRMIADPRAKALVDGFAGQWLQLRNLRGIAPDSERFPDFDDQLREGFARETELLFDSVVHEDRNVLDLLRADYTFVNERLAKHYGIPNIYGSHFRRIPVAKEARRGVLGHGSVLMVTSHADRTAPVLRGKWILDNLLGTPPPPPPPDVSTDLKEGEEGEPALTVRERMRRHRSNPQCASCHNLMDPLGLALENFDAVGAWRDYDAGQPIDSTAQLADGTAVDGVVALRNALLEKEDVLVGTITEKLLVYALGRGLRHYDMPAVRAVVRRAKEHDYRFSSLVVGIVKSMPFQMRTSESE
jgi:cytochrome c5